jgi:transcription initiation factor IIE alpha subunit
MAKRRIAALNLIELRGLKAIVELLKDGKTPAAIARLDGAVTALLATTKSQMAGEYLECPHCGSKEELEAWVEDRLCSKCGGELNVNE